MGILYHEIMANDVWAGSTKVIEKVIMNENDDVVPWNHLRRYKLSLKGWKGR